MLYRSAIFVCALFACAASQQTGDVRLSDGSNTKGRLEVYLAQGPELGWVDVCFNETAFPTGMAQAVCRQLGYRDFLKVGNVTTLEVPAGNASSERKFGGGDCKYVSEPENAPQHILRCFLLELAHCNNTGNMAIECNDARRKDEPYDTMVDIIQNDSADPPRNTSASEGFAFSYINGGWGPVCNMNHADADSFCRQLSFTNARDVEIINPSGIFQFPVVDFFECIDTSYSCLRECYPYPSADQVIECPSGYSYVTCTFETDFEDEFFEEYGTKSKCTATVRSGSAAGAVVGVLMAITAIVIIAVVLVCFFMPRCYLAKMWALKGPGVKINMRSEPKYDSI